MRALRWLICMIVAFPAVSSANCIPAAEALRHIGETKCIAGKVTRVDEGAGGVRYLGFCTETSCPFVAVIFPEDLKHIGDVRKLEGKSIQVHGDLTEYAGQAEIIVSESRQLKGEEAKLPPMPKAFDVEQRGHYSAGIFRHPKSTTTTKKRQPATLPVDIPEDPEQ